MKRRAVATAYFSTNLDIHEMKEEFGNDLASHIGVRCYKRLGTEKVMITMDNCEQFQPRLHSLKLKSGIEEKDIVGNVSGKIRQLKQRRRRKRYGEKVYRERNNVFRCTIYSEKYMESSC